MSDTQQETQTTQTEQIPGNSPEARTATGELKDQSQTTNTPPETEKKTEQNTEVKTEAKTDANAKDGDKPVVPEKYADFKAPDGLTINKEAIDAALPVFKELGLTQDAAQKLVDLQVAREAKANTAAMDAYNAMRADWRKEVLADTTLSTGGKVKSEVMTSIGRAIDSVGDPALSQSFREVMDKTGVGDNPAFMRMIHAWSKHVTEGAHVTGKGPAPGGQQAPDAKPKSIASAMYPNLS